MNIAEYGKTPKRFGYLKKALCLALILITLAAVPSFSRAASAAAAKISPGGDIVFGRESVINAVFAASDIGAVYAEVKYDPAALEYIGGDGTNSTQKGTVKIAAVAGAAGKQSITVGIKFKPLKVGNTGLSVVSSRLLGFTSEDDLGSPTAQNTITVKSAESVTVTKLEITQQPNMLAIPKGGGLDKDGMKVTSFFQDGHSEDVTSSAAVSVDTSTSGVKNVTVSYGGKTASFNAYVFGFKSVSLSLLGKIVINFTADFGGVEKAGYTPGILFFRERPYSADIESAFRQGKGVTKYTANGEYPMFSYDDIAAKEMNDIVYCVLYVQKGKMASFGSVSQISAAQYVSMAFNSYSNPKLRSMLVDMLNYGTAAQKYFNYKVNEPANAGLTQGQKALGTAGNVGLESCARLIKDGLSSSDAVIKGASLTLENEISLNYTAEINGNKPVKTAELLIFDNYVQGGTYNASTAKSKAAMQQSGNSYIGSIKNIPAKQMRKKYYARVHIVYSDGTEAFSDIGIYSIESYAYTVRASNAQNLKELTEAMMKYGDAASVYFAS